MARRSLRTIFFQNWFRLRRPMTLGVRGMVRDGEGRFLLVRHTYVAGWHFPGGGVEHGETVHDALAKELREEVGIALAGPAQLHGVFSNHASFRNDHIAVFVVRQWTQGQATARGEIAETGWFAPDALPEAVTPGTRARIREVAGGLAPSPYWTPPEAAAGGF